MSTVALVVALVVLACLAVMQVLLITGKPIGEYAWGGRHRVLPPRLRWAAGVAILLYAGFAWLLMSRGGWLPGGDQRWVVVTSWVLVGYLGIGVVLNLISRSRLERIVQTPVSLVLAASSFVVALA